MKLHLGYCNTLQMVCMPSVFPHPRTRHISLPSSSLCGSALIRSLFCSKAIHSRLSTYQIYYNFSVILKTFHNVIQITFIVIFSITFHLYSKWALLFDSYYSMTKVSSLISAHLTLLVQTYTFKPFFPFPS